jgi:tryptophanyl-tRNA synthetase
MRLLSGIKPTAEIHLGNYLGAIRQWVQLQREHDMMVMIADLHAMTVPYDAKAFSSATHDMAVDLLAAGIDPKKSALFIQSQVPEHAELAWYFNCVISLGELKRMHEYKEKEDTQKEKVNAGILAYPVLMAADILIYKAEAVPVGEDQKQHVELCRVIARNFNRRFGETFPEPKCLFTADARVMSLSDPVKKMSKSHGAKTYIALHDAPDAIRKKLASAITDVGPQSKEMSAGTANLFRLLETFAHKKTYQDMKSKYEGGSLKYVELKEVLADAIIAELKPIQEKRAALLKDPAYVTNTIEDGTSRARALAQKTMDEVRHKIGIL